MYYKFIYIVYNENSKQNKYLNFLWFSGLYYPNPKNHKKNIKKTIKTKKSEYIF